MNASNALNGLFCERRDFPKSIKSVTCPTTSHKIASPTTSSTPSTWKGTERNLDFHLYQFCRLLKMLTPHARGPLILFFTANSIEDGKDPRRRSSRWRGKRPGGSSSFSSLLLTQFTHPPFFRRFNLEKYVSNKGTLLISGAVDGVKSAYLDCLESVQMAEIGSVPLP